jgi:hypothetical protein
VRTGTFTLASLLFDSGTVMKHPSFVSGNDVMKKCVSTEFMGLGAFAASELDKVFSGYQPR